MSKKLISLQVNGRTVEKAVEPRTLLVHFLREELSLTGTHIGCETSHCGACTVDLDGQSIKSCTSWPCSATAREVRTVEGLASGGVLHAVQEGFYKEHGLQCGFCTPGMLMRALPISAWRTRIRPRRRFAQGMAGNLCRCTGYQNIVKAVLYAARKLREKQEAAA